MLTKTVTFLILSNNGKVLARAASRVVAQRVFDSTPGAAMIRRIEEDDSE